MPDATDHDRRDHQPEPAAHHDLMELYLAHRLRLERSILPLVDSQTIAEEMVQEVFTTLLDRTETPSPAYVRTAVVNAARSELRRREVARRHHAHFVNERLTAPSDDVEERCTSRLRFLDALEHLAALAPRQREVVWRRYALGESEREVANRLGISIGTVKTHASRGLRSLRERSEATPALADAVA